MAQQSCKSAEGLHWCLNDIGPPRRMSIILLIVIEVGSYHLAAFLYFHRNREKFDDERGGRNDVRVKVRIDSICGAHVAQVHAGKAGKRAETPAAVLRGHFRS